LHSAHVLEAVVPEAVVPEAVVPEAVVPEAVVPEAVVIEAVVPEAVVVELLYTIEAAVVDAGVFFFFFGTRKKYETDIISSIKINTDILYVIISFPKIL
jgi:hypothetical protein